MAEKHSEHYQEALRRIEENFRTKNIRLSLDDLSLFNLPKEIAQLTNLQTLFLSNTQISELPKEITQLTNLRRLVLNNTQISELPGEIAQLTNLQMLALDNNEVSKLPKEIAQLTNLQLLSLNNNQISKLPREIAQLSNLQMLYLGNNEISKLPKEIAQLTNLQLLSLDNNQISEVPKEIAQLANLRKLHLHGNQISELPKEIAQLTNLRELSLGSNQISEVPKEITQLINLQGLYLGNNQISELPKEITQLTNLRELYLSDNEISELPKEIAQLTDLQELSFSGNRISELPKEIAQLTNLQILYLNDNQLNIPPEIIERINKPQIILNYYFENVVGADRPLNEIKMLLLGEGEVGKSALVHRLIDDEFVAKGKTEGIDIHKWNVEVKKDCHIQINVWDFAGQEITHATHQFFLTKRSLYLLVLASRGDEKSNRLEEWLKVIQNFGGESPVIIVCNKSDEHRMSLDERALREKYPNIREIVKVSCKKGTNIKTLRQKILKEIRQMPHVFDPFSKRWFNVKQRLENLPENYIPFGDYLKICDAEGITEDIDRETLIKFLHDLGVVLNFREDRRLNDTNVLKPEWITESVYKILTSKALDDAHGVLTLEMVEEILEKKKYPLEKHYFIVQMMQKFERCFPLKQNEMFLVPDLLPKQQPEFADDWKPEETGLGFQYRYEIEPGSFITRFIVNMNEYIDGDTYWRKGVVLTNGKDNRALIKTDLEDKIIYIWIDGKMETRRGFLSIIRRQFEKIHETMTNLKITEYVQHEKGLISYEDLLDLEENRIDEHYFPHLKTKIDVRELLNGLETANERINRVNKKNEAVNKFRGYLLGDEIDSRTDRYDVALSYAGEDREYVSKVANELKNNNVKVFYDKDEQVNLWGKNLFDELDDIYGNRSEYVVMFISTHYAKKMWTDHERQSAFDNAIRAKKEYVLPARFDNTELKGLRKTIASISLENMTPKDFAQMIIKKLGKK